MIEGTGKRIRARRQRKGWSQEDLAAAAELSTRQLQRIEQDESEPSPETLRALAAALDAEPSELLTGFTTAELAEFQREFLCPHCGSKLGTRSAVPHEYGSDDVEIFLCGFTRGMDSRPCPADPCFPKWEDYTLEFLEADGQWWCYARGRTQEAREVRLQRGSGRSREEAERYVQRSYICESKGYAAAEAFMRPWRRPSGGSVLPLPVLRRRVQP